MSNFSHKKTAIGVAFIVLLALALVIFFVYPHRDYIRDYIVTYSRDIINALITTLSIVTVSLFAYTVNNIMKGDEYGIPRIALFKPQASRWVPYLAIVAGTLGGFFYIFCNALWAGMVVLAVLVLLLFEFWRLFIRTSVTIAKYIEKNQHKPSYKELPQLYLKNVAMAAARQENRFYAFSVYQDYVLRCARNKKAVKKGSLYNLFSITLILFEHILSNTQSKLRYRDFMRDCYVPMIEEVLKEYGSNHNHSVMLILAQLIGASMIVGFDNSALKPDGQSSQEYFAPEYWFDTIDAWLLDPACDSIWTTIRRTMIQEEVNTVSDEMVSDDTRYRQEFLPMFFLLLEALLFIYKPKQAFKQFQTLQHITWALSIPEDLRQKNILIIDIAEIVLKVNKGPSQEIYPRIRHALVNLEADQITAAKPDKLPRYKSRIMQLIDAERRERYGHR